MSKLAVIVTLEKCEEQITNALPLSKNFIIILEKLLVEMSHSVISIVSKACICCLTYQIIIDSDCSLKK